jgi:RNA 2',3'-cyclic 3'-phosphodiesterase
MNHLRAFVALEIPPALQDRIHQETAALRQKAEGGLIRWVPPHNVHLTLKFLGDVSAANLDLIKQMLRLEASQCPCFEMQVEGLGCFPSARQPRVIWIGLHAPAALDSLQRGIDAASARMGYASEEKSFAPHLTIGRVKQNLSAGEVQTVRAALEATHIGPLGSASVQAVQLFKSDLQSTGSVYTPLFAAPIGKD